MKQELLSYIKIIFWFFLLWIDKTCEACLLDKIAKTSLNEKSERSKELLSLIYTNVCRPMIIHVIRGYTYFITFIDDHSRYTYVYLLKHKSESFERFKEFINKIEKETENSIKIIWSDRDG
jgi:hypothetical protein